MLFSQRRRSEVFGLVAAFALCTVTMLVAAPAVRATTPIANDGFADAQVVTLGSSVLGSTVGAGQEFGEPTTSCGNASGGSIWYRATFNGNGTVRADTFGSDFDTVVGVYTGSAVNALSPVTCNDDASAGTRQSGVGFTAVAGTTYFFRVAGFNGATGAVQFTLDLGADLPSGATTVSATTSLNVPVLPPACAASSQSSHQWYRLASSTGGLVSLDTTGSTYDTVITVIRLTGAGFVTEACADDTGTILQASLTFTASPDVRYYMIVSGYNGATGHLQLAINNAAGNGSYAPGPVAALPDAPGTPAAVAVEEGATVSWTSPASSGSRPITGYRVTPILDGTAVASVTYPSTVTSQTLVGLIAGSRYTFKVAAISTAGVGADSLESNVVVPIASVLGVPTGLTLVGSGTTATVGWQAPAATGGSPISGYQLTPILGSTPGATISVGPTPTNHTFTGLTIGGTYTFQVAAVNADGPGPSALSSAFTATTPIANDGFADAQVVTLGSSVLGSTVGAGQEFGEPTTSCGNASGGSIWYRATFNGNGTVRADTFGSDFDTVVGVYTGSAVNALSPVTCNDDASAGTRQSGVGFTAVAGTTYFFRVAGFNGATGAVQFTLDLGADLPSGATTVSATTSLNVPVLPPACAASSQSSHQWYRLASSTGGLVSLDTTGSTYDTVITVIRLTGAGFVTEACADDTGTILQASLTFTASPDVRYYMIVSGYNGATGHLQLAINNAAGNGSYAPGPVAALPPQNHAPIVAAPIPDQVGTAGVAFSFVVPTATFSDPDGDALSYSSALGDDSALPAWLTFDGTTRTFSGTPATGDVGMLSVKVTATDPGPLSVTDTFDIVIGAAASDKGTITVVKHLVPSSDPGLFDLSVDAQTASGVGDGATLGPVTLDAGLHNVHEEQHAGTVARRLRDLGQLHRGPADGLNPASPLSGPGGFMIISVPVAAGDQWTCTMTDTHKGTITVVKHLVPEQ